MHGLPNFVKDAAGKLPAVSPALHVGDGVDIPQRLVIMLLIFTISLFAVSFPTITATFRSIRVPNIVFFVGKHFGTGVILSTAFVHLLQDAFKALLNPTVNERWRIGVWAGMIVLGSLLSIFLVEYISTAYVDRLQSYSSVPSTPTVSPVPTPAASIQMEFESTRESPAILVQSPHESHTWSEDVHDSDRNHQIGGFAECGHPSGAPLPFAPPELADEVVQPPKVSSTLNERTPLRAGTDPRPQPSAVLEPQSHSYGTTSLRTTRPPAQTSSHLAQESAASADTFFSGGHHRHEPRGTHASHYAQVSRWRWFWGGDSKDPAVVNIAQPAPSHSHSYSHHHHHPPLHSHTLVHQHSCPEVREVRLPTVQTAPSKAGSRKVRPHAHECDHGDVRGSRHHGHSHLDMERWVNDIDEGDCMSDTEDGDVTKVGRKRQVIGILVLQLGIMIHSLVIGLTLSITTGPEFTSLVAAIFFHQLFEGLSLGIRIAALPSTDSEHGIHHLPGHTLKPLLAITFATTTPLGIAIGLAALGGSKSNGPNLILVQGVMSAVSAGMLIYATCVEMLAGDFVMDAHLWRSSVQRQVLALVSLFAGVAAMAAIG